MKSGARDRSVIGTRMTKGGGGGDWDDAGGRSTTKSRTSSEHMNKRRSTCMCMHWPVWVAISEGRGLVDSRERLSFWETHDEKREEELWTVE